MLKAVLPASAPDLELARRCVAQDAGAQRELYEAHRRRVHLILFRILGSNRDMEDLLQEALVAVFRSLASYRGEASLATWVDRITTRTALRHLARRSAPPIRLELVQSEPDGGASPDEELHVREVARRLYAVLEHLAPTYRIAFALHVLDGRPIPELAAMTGITRVAAKARVWRARNMVERRVRTDPVLLSFLRELKAGAK